MDIIATERLNLVLLTEEFLRASLAGDFELASALLGVPIAADWKAETWLMNYRLRQMEDDPETEPYLLRAVILREENVMVGQVGFHDRPGAEYLDSYASGGLEMGYRIYEGYRRRGYALEAARGMMAWAEAQHPGIPFVVSIAPDNAGSLRIAAILGFQRCGEHIDEIDGLEYIFVRH